MDLKRNRNLIRRLISLWLAAVLAVTMGGFAAFAETEDEYNDEGLQAESEGEYNDAGLPLESQDAEPIDTEDEVEVFIPEVMDSFRVALNSSAEVVFEWEPVDTAAYYVLYLDGAGYKCTDTETCQYSFTGLDGMHSFRISAVDADGNTLTSSDTLRIMTFNENIRSRLSSRTVNASKLGINLRTMLGESSSGYSVVQGGCTDGTYAYYLMVSSYNQKGRVLKMRISDRKVVKSSGVLNTYHGNGMTYDSKRNKLVAIAREGRKQELTVIDADTLKVTRQQNVKYSNYKNAPSGSLTSAHQNSGLAAIAYSPRYDVYLALERTYHNILIFDPDTFEAKGIVFTRITSKYPGTYQAMDADDRYVYLLLSYYNSSQPYNMILALDWNSENLLDAVNGTGSQYAGKGWYCGNNGSGEPDAAIRLNTSYEAENIYHTTDASGREHFYLSEYFSNPVYKTVKQKEAYKVKWKKVTKKVKWKRVKKKGKWKWKYKKKKVWKYKTKYRTVTKTVLSHYNRDNYVYDLGIF